MLVGEGELLLEGCSGDPGLGQLLYEAVCLPYGSLQVLEGDLKTGRLSLDLGRSD